MSQTTSTTSIEDLPWEMISELFKNLPPKDLASCSLVNKRWHSIFTAFKLHSLVATDSDGLFRWYHSKRPIQEAERCRRWMFLRLAKKPLLSNLRHLAVLTPMYESGFDLNDLNRFQQLVHLEIMYFPHEQKRTHLSLPKLKVLAFPEWNYHCVLSIDFPRLSTLLYVGDNGIASLLKVKHPETIRKLETNMFGEILIQFKSVDCLVTKEFEAISTATLLSLPNLRELRYNGNVRYRFEKESRRGAGMIDRLKKMLSEFLDQAKKLRGSDFLFTFAGLQVTNVDQIDFGVQVHEKSGREYVHMEYIYMKNYHHLESGPIDFVHQADYTLLLSYATGEFPLCFSQKFPNIYLVYATAKVQDVDHFLWFLKSLRSPSRLKLVETGLGQAFYDQLPAVAPSLLGLHLAVGHCEDRLQVNFDFLGRLSRLSDLVIEPVLYLESLPSLTRSLGRLEECNFHVQSSKESFKIRKEPNSTQWDIRGASRAGRLLLENPEEILNFFEDLQD